MRSRTILILSLVLICGPVIAATLTVTIPAEAVANAVLRCEELRQVLRVRSAEWNNDVCATEFTRLGLRQFNADQEREAARQQAIEDLNAALAQYDSDWPGVTQAVCGDGTIDSEAPFNETCDTSGASATCDIDCTAVACGDGTLNTFAGEQCDDGNTEAGDGCDPTCQAE